MLARKQVGRAGGELECWCPYLSAKELMNPQTRGMPAASQIDKRLLRAEFGLAVQEGACV
jgi:hypothetical protein